MRKGTENVNILKRKTFKCVGKKVGEKETEQQNNSTDGCLSVMLSLFWECLYWDYFGSGYDAVNIPKSLFTKIS